MCLTQVHVKPMLNCFCNKNSDINNKSHWKQSQRVSIVVAIFASLHLSTFTCCMITFIHLIVLQKPQPQADGKKRNCVEQVCLGSRKRDRPVNAFAIFCLVLLVQRTAEVELTFHYWLSWSNCVMTRVSGVYSEL